MTQKHSIMVLVAAATVNTGPVKGILQFIKNIHQPGIRFHLYNFLEAQHADRDSFAEDTASKGVPCQFIRLGIRFGNHNYPLMIVETLRAVREKRITILQTHGFKPTFLGLCSKAFGNVTWICFLHGTTAENTKVRMYNWLDNLMQRWADVTVLVSENQRQKVFGGQDRSRVQVLHNAVDLDHPVKVSLQETPLRERLGIGPAEKVIAVVGRLSPEKGVDVFVRALSIVEHGHPGVHGVIVGEGQEKRALIELAHRLGLAKRTFFAGFTDTPGDYMLDADIIVLPSRSEGIPNVALEAMALGKPVVATAVGGTPEVIEHEQSGLLVPAEQPEAMAEAILRLCVDQQLVNRLQNGAITRVREHFSVEARCRKLIEIYRSCGVA